MSNTRLGGYPASIGNKVASLVRHLGPSAYTVVSPATPPTGGDQIKASAFGLKFIEYMAPAIDETGAYYVLPIPTTPGPCATWILRWFTIAGGPPATPSETLATSVDLSAKAVRLYAIGLP
jgi:hypothetical protein